MRRMCCVCQKTQWKETWRLLPVEIDEPVTHGYCPDCFAAVMTEIQSVIAERERGGSHTLANSCLKNSLAQEGACV